MDPSHIIHLPRPSKPWKLSRSAVHRSTYLLIVLAGSFRGSRFNFKKTYFSAAKIMPVDEIPSFKVHTSSWGVLDPASRKTFFGVVGSLYKPLVLSTKKHDLTSKPTNRTCSCGRRAGRHHGVVYDPPGLSTSTLWGSISHRIHGTNGIFYLLIYHRISTRCKVNIPKNTWILWVLCKGVQT